MLKGTATIELTDVKTGRKEVVKHDNLITNAVNDVLTLNPGIFKAATNYASLVNPIIPNLIGGILLCEDTLEEDPEKYWVPADNPLVGYSNNAASPGTDPKRGSVNRLESGALDDGKGYRFVFDFSTSQGNGTISALGLTSAAGGRDGKGNPVTTAKGIYAISNWNAMTNNTEENKHTFSNMRDNADIVALEAGTGKAVFARMTAANTILIRKYDMGLLSVGLTETLNAYPCNCPYEEYSIITSLFGGYNIGTTNEHYCTFLQDGEGYIWGFEHSGNAAGNSSGNAKVNWIRIKIDDLSSEEGTWEIAAQLYRFGYTYYYLITDSSNKNMRRLNYAVIQDGYLYCFNYSLTGVYKISLTNPTDVKFMEHPSGAVVLPPVQIYNSYTENRYCNISTAFNVMYDTVYFANGYIENGKIVETAYNFSATSDPKNNNYPYGLCSTGKPGLRIGPFLFSFGGDYGINGYPQKLSSMNILGNYLATINNLNKPVQKTADKTMKITYILREEE